MRSLFLLLPLALLFPAPGRAVAHDLRATVKFLPDFRVEAGFDDETPAEGARVAIKDEAGTEISTGKTDEKGVCRLAKLKPGKYVAIVESLGHRDEVKFEVIGSDDGNVFSNWRLDKRLGLAIGLGALAALTAAFWWFHLRNRAG